MSLGFSLMVTISSVATPPLLLNLQFTFSWQMESFSNLWAFLSLLILDKHLDKRSHQYRCHSHNIELPLKSTLARSLSHFLVVFVPFGKFRKPFSVVWSPELQPASHIRFFLWYFRFFLTHVSKTSKPHFKFTRSTDIISLAPVFCMAWISRPGTKYLETSV